MHAESAQSPSQKTLNRCAVVAPAVRRLPRPRPTLARDPGIGLVVVAEPRDPYRDSDGRLRPGLRGGKPYEEDILAWLAQEEDLHHERQERAAASSATTQPAHEATLCFARGDDWESD